VAGDVAWIPLLAIENQVVQTKSDRRCPASLARWASSATACTVYSRPAATAVTPGKDDRKAPDDPPRAQRCRRVALHHIQPGRTREPAPDSTSQPYREQQTACRVDGRAGGRVARRRAQRPIRGTMAAGRHDRNATLRIGRSTPDKCRSRQKDHHNRRPIRGRKNLERRAEELRAESPGWVSRPAGPRRSSTTSATSASTTSPPTNPPVASGTDIARTRDGVIIERYTIVN